MSRFSSFLLGVFCGAGGLILSMNYYIVRSKDNVHLVPKVAAKLEIPTTTCGPTRSKTGKSILRSPPPLSHRRTRTSSAQRSRSRARPRRRPASRVDRQVVRLNPLDGDGSQEPVHISID